MISKEPKLYRSRTGIILGVCKGIAQWREMPVGWVRILFIILFLCTAGVPMLVAYFVAAILMKPEPIASKTDRDRPIDI